MTNKKANHLFLISTLVILIAIVSFLIFRQVDKNNKYKEESLISAEIINEDLSDDDDIFYSSEEMEELKKTKVVDENNGSAQQKNQEYDIAEVKKELKHEIYIHGNGSKKWFNEKINEINGTEFLRQNNSFNFERDMKDKKFYLIVASIKNHDKAISYRNQLNDEGFRSILLPTKIGFYRVCIQAYNENQKELALQEYHEARRNKRFSKAWVYVNHN